MNRIVSIVCAGLALVSFADDERGENLIKNSDVRAQKYLGVTDCVTTKVPYAEAQLFAVLPAKLAFPLALNDETGVWKVRVTEPLTGVAAERTIAVK